MFVASHHVLDVQHFPTGFVAIAAVGRAAVITLHRVIDDELEEGGWLAFERAEEGGLPGEGEFEQIGKFGQRGVIARGEAGEGTGELAIDVIEDACLAGAWRIVGGDDLVAKGFHDGGFSGAQNL